MTSEIQKILNVIISDNIKVVSFDIFDTLLMRPCSTPTEIFKLAGKKIHYAGDIGEMRRLAEVEARKCKGYGIEDVTLDQIYDSFKNLFHIDSDVLEKYRQAELDTEYQLLYPRKTVNFLFQTALNAGKQVIITSDMYLPKEFITSVLAKNGYNGYSRIYISCEEKLSKGSGNLFKKLINDYSEQGIHPKEILHIGDNFHADITSAKNCGLKAEYIPSAYNEFIRRDYMKQLISCIHKSSDNSFLVGFIANTIFDDPFTRFDLKSFSGGNTTFFSYVMIMPLLFSFTKWLLEESNKDGIEELVLVYRDGYLPEKLIAVLSEYYDKIPSIKNIYLSRAIRYNYFALQDNGLFNSISDIPVSPNMSVDHFIKYRLLASSEKDIEEATEIFLNAGYNSTQDKIGAYSQFITIFSELENIYQRNASLKRDIIDKYCNSVIDQDKKIGVFDVGYRGSVSRFLASNFKIKNTCYHLLSNSLISIDVPDNVNLKSYIHYGIDTVKKCIILHPLIEDIISKQEGSAIDIVEEGDNFKIESEASQENCVISQIQNDVLSLSKNFVKLMGEYIPLMQLDHYLHFEFLVKFLVRPNKLDADIISKLNFNDSKFIIASDNIYARWYNRYFPALKKITSTTPKLAPPASKSVSAVSEVTTQENNASSSRFFRIKLSAYKFCERLHILEFMQRVYRKFFKSLFEKDESSHNIVEKVPNKTNEPASKIDQRNSMEAEITTALERLNSYDLLKSRQNTLILGDMVSYDKGVCNYLNLLAKQRPKDNFVLLSEATWVNETNTRNKIYFPHIIVPQMFGKNRFPANAFVSITEEDKKLIDSKPYLQWAIKNWNGRHVDMSLEYAQFLAVCSYHYYSNVFNLLNTKTIILWNQFHALHHILENLAKEKGIAVKFMEFGSLPGTIAIENLGQMGESFPAVEAAKFKALPVSKTQIKNTEKILNFLKNSKMNRNTQPNDGVNDLGKIKKDKPIIFYAGQNDFESGIFPYTKHSREYHSPVFQSTNEALFFLADLCKKNGWQLLYKPHPIVKMFSEHSIKIPNDVIYLEKVDINDVIDFSDVTVTILSQVAYVSLIRAKATLMLGYNQLKDKGCAYEAYSLDKIESEMKNAIEKGHTAKQKAAFVKHAAQLIHYYLYDDLVPKDVAFGQEQDKIII